MKFCPLKAEFFHAKGQQYRHDEAYSRSRNFAKTSEMNLK